MPCWVVRRFITLSIRLWHPNPSALSAPAQSWVFRSALPHCFVKLTNPPMRLHLFVRSAWRESHLIHLACRLGQGGCRRKCGEASAQVASAGQRGTLSSSSNPSPQSNTRARNMAWTWRETRAGKDLTVMIFSFFVSHVSFCLGKLSNENILAVPFSLEPQTACNF